MLNFGQPPVALHYFVLVLISFAGVLQIVAAHYQLKSLSLLPRQRRPWLGSLLGSVLIVTAFAWFIVATPGMLRPGPAGLEIGVLFSTASLLALLICRFTAVLIGD